MSSATIFPPLTVKAPTETGRPSPDRDRPGDAVDERRLHEQPGAALLSAWRGDRLGAADLA